MKKYLKINEKMIVREDDNMVFSAKNMKIYKFNEKGFKVVNTINNNSKLTKDELYEILKEEYTKEEFDNLINKMMDNNIIVVNEE